MASLGLNELTYLGRCLLRPYSSMVISEASSDGLILNPTASLMPSQWRSRIPGLHMVFNTGRCCLNLSIFPLTRSATLRGPGWSPKDLVSLYMVRHISPTSFSISSAFRLAKGPVPWREHNLFMCCFGETIKIHWPSQSFFQNWDDAGGWNPS